MLEELVTFETAKLATKKGFGNFCEEMFDKSGKPYSQRFLYKSAIPTGYNRPTQSLLQKWLREVHNIYVSSLPYQDYSDNWKPIDLMYYYSVIDLNKFIKQDINNGTIGELGSDINFKTYEEALEIGLQQALQLIPKTNEKLT